MNLPLAFLAFLLGILCIYLLVYFIAKILTHKNSKFPVIDMLGKTDLDILEERLKENYKKQIESNYKIKRNNCRTKKRTEPKQYIKPGLWQRIKAKQKMNNNK